MLCSHASQLMDEVLNGEAGSEREAALLAHVADCASCRAEWRALQRVEQLLVTAPSVWPSPDFSTRVIARLAPRQPRQNPWAGTLVLVAGAVLFGVLMLFSMMDFYWAQPGGVVEAGMLFFLQFGAMLLSWVQAGWHVRQVVLESVPPGLILLYAMISVIAGMVWYKLITNVHNILQPIDQ